jgi:hypothetical protein
VRLNPVGFGRRRDPLMPPPHVHLYGVTAQVFRLKAEGYKTTQMRNVLCDYAWFVSKSLQSSAFSLST